MNRPSDLSDLRIDLQEALLRLPPKQRQAAVLYSQGMTQVEIAEVMGVSHQAISRILARMVAKIRHFSL